MYNVLITYQAKSVASFQTWRLHFPVRSDENNDVFSVRLSQAANPSRLNVIIRTETHQNTKQTEPIKTHS